MFAPNETIMVYRPGPTDTWGCAFANPYPPDNTSLVFTAPALVKHHVKNGRMGRTSAPVHWTHKMLLAVSDIRDSYSADMTLSGGVQTGDLVLIGDYPLPGRC